MGLARSEGGDLAPSCSEAAGTFAEGCGMSCRGGGGGGSMPGGLPSDELPGLDLAPAHAANQVAHKPGCQQSTTHLGCASARPATPEYAQQKRHHEPSSHCLVPDSLTGVGLLNRLNCAFVARLLSRCVGGVVPVPSETC